MVKSVAVVCFLVICVWQNMEFVSTAPAQTTPRALCNQYRAKSLKGFKLAKCEIDMKLVLDKVTDTEYHKLVALCVTTDMGSELCSLTIVKLFEKGFQQQYIWNIINADNVNAKEDVETISTLSVETYKKIDLELGNVSIWYFAKEVAKDEACRNAIEDFLKIDKSKREHWGLNVGVICSIGKTVKERNFSGDDVTLLFDSVCKGGWKTLPLQELLSSNTIKTASLKQISFMLLNGKDLSLDREYYVKVQFPNGKYGAWPYEEMPFMKNIPADENQISIAQFTAQMNEFRNLLQNIFPLPLYKKLKDMAVNKGVPEAFAVEFLCYSTAFIPPKDNGIMAYPISVYKDMVNYLINIYNRKKEVLNDEELADFNKALFIRIVKSVVSRVHTDASAILKAADEAKLDIKQMYDFIKTENYRMDQFSASYAVNFLSKLGVYDIFDQIRSRNITYLYSYIHLLENEKLKTAKDVVITFFQSNATPTCRPELIELVIKFNDAQSTKLTEDQRAQALELVCQESQDEVTKAYQSLFFGLKRETSKANTYDELIRGLKSKLPSIGEEK